MALMAALPRRQRVTIAIVSFILGMMVVPLGDRAWIVMPPVMFLTMLGMMAMDGERRLTLRWVLLAAAGCLAAAAFLKIM